MIHLQPAQHHKIHLLPAQHHKIHLPPAQHHRLVEEIYSIMKTIWISQHLQLAIHSLLLAIHSLLRLIHSSLISHNRLLTSSLINHRWILMSNLINHRWIHMSSLGNLIQSQLKTKMSFTNNHSSGSRFNQLTLQFWMSGKNQIEDGSDAERLPSSFALPLLSLVSLLEM